MDRWPYCEGREHRPGGKYDQPDELHGLVVRSPQQNFVLLCRSQLPMVTGPPSACSVIGLEMVPVQLDEPGLIWSIPPAFRALMAEGKSLNGLLCVPHSVPAQENWSHILLGSGLQPFCPAVQWLQSPDPVR